MDKKRACVIVLGDIGRSPRMQYHTQSLLEQNCSVDIIAYVETQPPKTTTNLQIYELFLFPHLKLPNSIKYVLKTIWQTINLLYVFMIINQPDFLLVQNPPAIPTLMLCYAYCKLRKCKFIIDWHNYTYSMLSLNSSPQSFIVKLAYRIEHFFGKRANANFCVSKAMKQDLRVKWGIEATVLYDRPPEIFTPISLEEKHRLFMQLGEKYKPFLPKDHEGVKEQGVVESTRLTQKLSDESIIYRDDRPAVLVSSTSWTPDEDFGILLEALKEYEDLNNKHYPDIICVITGKGPQKEYYKEIISKLEFKKVCIITPWLESEDYPKLLAAADLGVCLHWSSSGLDLPMKIVDMFGAGIPVCAKKFHSINELVRHGENGFIFENSSELFDQLKFWFKDFPNNIELNDLGDTFHININQFQSLRWRENWLLNAFPIFNSVPS